MAAAGDFPGEQRAAVFAALEQAFAAKTRDEWFEELRDANICVGQVNSMEEALADPHARARGMASAWLPV